MTPPAASLPDLHVAVVVPPPVNGMTLVSQRMLDAFTDRAGARLRVRTVSARPGQAGVAWTLAKHGAFLGGALKAAVAGLFRPRARRPICYFVPDSSAGLWLNLLEAPLLRWGYRRVWLHHHVFSYVAARDRRMALFLAILGPRARHITLGPAMSEGLARQYGLPAVHLVALGNADFVSDIPEQAPARRALRCLGYLGNITREKGIEAAMATMADVQERAPDVMCRIAGPIADPVLRAEVEAFCAAAPATRRWLGPVQGAAKAAFLNEVDVLLFPSRYRNEALPVTIYEALAAAAPVLATPRGVIPDQLAGQDWIFDADRFPRDAVARLLSWHADPEAFRTASHGARALFMARRAEDRAALSAVLARILDEEGAACPPSAD